MRRALRKTVLWHVCDVMGWIAVIILAFVVGVLVLIFWLVEKIKGLRRTQKVTHIMPDDEARDEKIAAFLAAYEWLQDHKIDDVEIARRELKQFRFQVDDVTDNI